jgi:hypothetical protein
MKEDKILKDSKISKEGTILLVNTPIEVITQETQDRILKSRQ